MLPTDPKLPGRLLTAPEIIVLRFTLVAVNTRLRADELDNAVLAARLKELKLVPNNPIVVKVCVDCNPVLV